jgi:tRNA(Leu) C34 or U34 (ribose-2'-O)-methylase TrmL
MPKEPRFFKKGQAVVVPRDAPPTGKTPAIVLINPRFAHNVGMVVRLASCYGLDQVWYTGDRVRLEVERRGKLPREERMKGYREVEIVSYERPLECFPADAVPVAVEIRPNSERLHSFEHPENAVYVFGPEDGSIPDPILRVCHRFLVIPTRHCLNLATAVSTILWDRVLKRHQKGLPGYDFTDTPEVMTSSTDPVGIGLYDDTGQTP